MPHGRYRAVGKERETNESIKLKELLLLPSAAVGDIGLILKADIQGTLSASIF